ncbi:hypothetical protein ACIBF5_26845 [Micromonospora sp. NPDC050417]|uniref:hypothetical protein n=1 Tax=Micromonospora sp. NPDC050417 TaxID=3364280 RepID=UPI0037A0FFFD
MPRTRGLTSEEMAVMHALVLALALLALVCIPALVAAMICADELVHWLAAEWDARRVRRREQRALDHLERALHAETGFGGFDPAELDRPGGPAIEQIAADLRRLGGERLGPWQSSRSGHGDLLRAYDERLRLASRYLGVAEHLADLDGVDREIERVRVEGELEAAGLMLHQAGRHPYPEW